MKLKQIIILVAIIGLAILLRFWQLGETPKGFYLDEAAIGYNAYSIIKTGKDEFGQTMPILFRSFGDFKAPIYIYLLVPIYQALGMSVWSTRVLSAGAGVASVVFLYLLVSRVSKDRKLGLLAAGLLAISPWGIIFSRTSYETNVALTLLIISLWSFYKSEEKAWWLLPSGLLASLSFLTYHSERVIVPLIFVGLIFRHWKRITWRENLKIFLITLILAGVVIIPTVRLFASPGFLSRLNSLSIFAKPTTALWGYDSSAAGEETILNNRELLLARQWSSLYVSYFSPRYLFGLGDPGPRSSFPDLPTFYLWQLPFLIIGMRVFLKNKIKNNKELIYLTGLMLLVSPIPASITQDPYSSIRALPMVVPLLILIALGMKNVTERWGKEMNLIFAVLVLWSVGKLYFSVFKLNDYYRAEAWNYGTQQLAAELKKIDPATPIIVDARSEPYSQILFYLKTDPVNYQKENREVEKNDYYTNMSRSVEKKIVNITVRKVTWETDIFESEIIVGDELTFNDKTIREHCLTEVFTIKGLNGQKVLFRGVRTNPEAKVKFNEIKEKLKKEGSTKNVDDCEEVLKNE